MHRWPIQMTRHNAVVAVFGFLIAFSSITAPHVLAEQASGQDKPVGNEAQQVQWLEGIRLAQGGSFNEAASKVDSVIAAGVQDSRVQNVDKWLHDIANIQLKRSERAEQDYRKYVEWVQQDIQGEKKDHRRGWWRLAILDCARAYNSSVNREATLNEPWFNNAVEGAIKAATEYEKDHKWLEAARIYAPLTEMLPQNKQYRKSLELCQAYVRIELLYSADSDWEASVKNIYPNMATDAFRKIEENYLREPVFKDAAAAGLEQLLRMVHSKKLEKVFPSLADRDNADVFAVSLEERLKQVKRTEKMDADGLTEVFERVLSINKEVDLFPDRVVIREFVHGAFQPLDQFSDMLWPADLQEFNKHTQGKFPGVGVQIQKPPGEPILVVSPLDDSTPAYKKGIQPGDLITEVDGSPTDNITINEAVRRITGPPGTSVTLTIKRTGIDKPFKVKLERQEITISTIKGHERNENGGWDYLIDPQSKIGYVRMTNFTEGTIDELQGVIRRLRDEQHMKGLIFDLRGNPGGPLKAAVDVSAMFLDGNKKIVSTKDRQGQVWSKSSANEAGMGDFPMIVLIDEWAASASEIVSGALQVHHRALILGERSFGKGSVQQVLPLNKSNMAYLKLTTAHYYLPNGRCLHREDSSTAWGVDPDVQVRLVPKEYIKMNKLRLKKDILRGKGQAKMSEEELNAVTDYSATKPENDKDKLDDGKKDKAASKAASKPADDDPQNVDEAKLTPPRKDDNEFPNIDPQLDAALTLMRIRIESGQSWPQPTDQLLAKQASGVTTEDNQAATK